MNRTGRTLVVVVLLSTAAIAARWSEPAGPDPRAVATPGAVSAHVGAADSVPATVLTAAGQGRYWRASRLLHAYLATVQDTTPSQRLLAARLDAGWGDWDGVRRRLEGQDWLPRVEGGAGLELLGRSLAETGQPAEAAEVLGRYVELAPTPESKAVVHLRRGLALTGADRTEPALDAFDQAADALPWFRDWTALMAARAAAAGGDTAAVRTRLAAAGELAPRSAWRLRLEAALAAGDTLAAREAALEVARSDPSAAIRATAWAELGALRLEAGDTVRAREAFVTATEVPGSGGAVRAARALTDLDPSPEEWRTIGGIYARHGNAQRAAEGYRAYLDAGVGTELERWEARLALGRARYNAGRYDQAERGLLALASEPVPARIAATALYLAGRAQYRQGRSEAGQATLARLSDRFPGEPAVTEGLYLLADLKHDDQALAEARRYYREAAESSPSRAEAGLALMRLGGLALLEQDYAGAVAIFEEYRSLHPDGRRWAQSTYWAARSHRALGRSAKADSLLRDLRRADPLSYYGMRAAGLLGERLLDIPMAPEPVVDSAAHSVAREKLRRVDLLAELGRRDDLVREVERVRSDLKGRTGAEYALAEALNDRGYTLSAINLGWELYRRDRRWNRRLLRIIYPFPFRTMVVPEAREQRLDPYLVAGLIRRESAFNPTVSSGAGAIGLMQIMPPTGRTLARAVGPEDFEPALLRQPEVNVHLGTRYLRGMLDRFDGELPLVLSAYNAGPTRAVRWKELPEARDPELFIDRIPYNETREYVRKVLVHRALYEALYPVLD